MSEKISKLYSTPVMPALWRWRQEVQEFEVILESWRPGWVNYMEPGLKKPNRTGVHMQNLDLRTYDMHVHICTHAYHESRRETTGRGRF